MLEFPTKASTLKHHVSQEFLTCKTLIRKSFQEISVLELRKQGMHWVDQLENKVRTKFRLQD